MLYQRNLHIRIPLAMEREVIEAQYNKKTEETITRIKRNQSVNNYQKASHQHLGPFFVGSLLAIAEKSSMNGFGTSGGLVHSIVRSQSELENKNIKMLSPGEN